MPASCWIRTRSIPRAPRRSTGTCPRPTASWWRCRCPRTAARTARCTSSTWPPARRSTASSRACSTRRPAAAWPGATTAAASGTRATPTPASRPERQHFYQQVWYHHVGDDPSKDRYVLGKDFPRVAEIALDGRHDGRAGGRDGRQRRRRRICALPAGHGRLDPTGHALRGQGRRRGRRLRRPVPDLAPGRAARQAAEAQAGRPGAGARADDRARVRRRDADRRRIRRRADHDHVEGGLRARDRRRPVAGGDLRPRRQAARPAAAAAGVVGRARSRPLDGGGLLVSVRDLPRAAAFRTL